jgi:pSer/pThr/pTyr-binding forkhead associated (FHA) protein
MARDVLESLHRRLTGLYDKLTGAVPGDYDLRPRDVVRRIVEAMEDRQREGLDGNIYVPNVYTLQVTVENDDERQYLRTFLGANELAAALADEISTRGYSVRGMLVFTVDEVNPVRSVTSAPAERVRVLCKFDPNAGMNDPTPGMANAAGGKEETPAPAEPGAVSSTPAPESHDDPGTLPAGATTLAQISLVSRNGEPGKTFPIGVQGAKIGRGKNAGNTIILDNDPLISKSHARIVFQGEGFLIYDQNSMNGTVVNGKSVTPATGVPLSDGDEIQIGDAHLRFVEFGGDKTLPRGGIAPRASSAPDLAATGIGVSGFPMSAMGATITGGLAFCMVAGDGTVFPLASHMTIGRSLTEDISLVGDGVAAHHALLSAREEAVYVEDEGTPGGTFVNGERIPAHFPVALYPGDVVAFGGVSLRIQKGYNSGYNKVENGAGRGF